MKDYTYARALRAALIGIAMTGSATTARADIKDYEFQLVDKTVKKGDAIISVRLVHKPARVRRGRIFGSACETRLPDVPTTQFEGLQ
ncbi:MAG: hypothetical protein NVV83_08420 [Afipia sp.]|nr:hypothetical protein [Afipia sp.]